MQYSFQFRHSSKVMPKKRTTPTCFSSVSLIIKFKVAYVFCPLWDLIKYVFSMFKCCVLEEYQLLNDFNISLLMVSYIVSDLSDKTSDLSSAYMIKDASEVNVSSSLVYNRNSTGSKIEPCGTPILISSYSEWNLLIVPSLRKVTLTDWFLSFRNDWTQSRATPLIPYLDDLFKSLS